MARNDPIPLPHCPVSDTQGSFHSNSIPHEAGGRRSIFWLRNRTTARVCVLASLFLKAWSQTTLLLGIFLRSFSIVGGVVGATTIEQNGESPLEVIVIPVLSAFAAVIQPHSYYVTKWVNAWTELWQSY